MHFIECDRCHWTFFPQISKKREMTTHCGCWRERVVALEKTPRTSVINRMSRKLKNRRYWGIVWINIANWTNSVWLLLDHDTCAFIVEKNTNGRIAWGGIKESTVAIRRENFLVIYVTKSSSTDMNCEITLILIIVYESAMC